MTPAVAVGRGMSVVVASGLPSAPLESGMHADRITAILDCEDGAGVRHPEFAVTEVWRGLYCVSNV